MAKNEREYVVEQLIEIRLLEFEDVTEFTDDCSEKYKTPLAKLKSSQLLQVPRLHTLSRSILESEPVMNIEVPTLNTERAKRLPHLSFCDR